MTKDPIVEVDRLIFEYPGKRALDDVTFAIEAGSITALIGPNGAGKTSLLRCLAALAPPFSGTVRIDGLNVEDHPRACHRRLGFLADFFGLYDDLTVGRCLAYRAAARGTPASERASAIDLAARRLDLSAFLARRAGTLSRGERQRLAIAQAIVHQPKLLLLDEPASGLDPGARWSLSQLLVELAERGTTIVVSSHIISELEDYSTDVLILSQGRIVEHAPFSSAGQETTSIRIELSRADDRLDSVLDGFDGLANIAIRPLTTTLDVVGGADRHRLLLKHLVDNGLPVSGFAVDRSRMHDVYRAGMDHSDRAGGN